MKTSDYSQWFRGSTPYISAHRGKTFVVYLGGDALAHPNITNIVHDLALLHVLGVQLVLVHGGRPQLNAALPDSASHAHRRITQPEHMDTVTGVYGLLRSQLEGLFSTGLPNTPLHNVDISVVSGNFVTAKPLGVLDGVDHLFTGQLRNLDNTRVQRLLDANNIVLQSPLGFSSSGQAFNLASEELAADISIALQADKVIFFDETEHLNAADGQRESTVTPSSVEDHFGALSATTAQRFSAMARAVRAGVTKAHQISFATDGGLLQELFTADGAGTQIIEEKAQPVRAAKLDDVGDIVEIIRPLEESGALLRRSRDRLEQEIEHFMVAEVDGVTVGCCAVYLHGEQAELACVAVSDLYRRGSAGVAIGANLLLAAEQHAMQVGATGLFVLTTQTQDWFEERGFQGGDVNDLPETKQSLYNWQRGSKVLFKSLG
jgi:amino-acid N-acetyltransferase